MGPRPPPPQPPPPPPPGRPRPRPPFLLGGGGGFTENPGGGVLSGEGKGGGRGRRGRRAPFTAKTSPLFGENAFFWRLFGDFGRVFEKTQEKKDRAESLISAPFRLSVSGCWVGSGGEVGERGFCKGKDPAMLKTLRVVNHYGDSNSLPRW